MTLLIFPPFSQYVVGVLTLLAGVFSALKKKKARRPVYPFFLFFFPKLKPLVPL
ncbi:hypothetical protein P348_01676 [Enterobacter sp. DC3]|nr:hypothetical protein P348_01676 [Enterobacter sp. DC3]